MKHPNNYDLSHMGPIRREKLLRYWNNEASYKKKWKVMYDESKKTEQ